MAMASVCCSPVRPIVHSCGASTALEPVPSERVTLAEPAVRESPSMDSVPGPAARETPTMHSVMIFDRQQRAFHQFPVAENQYILQAAESHDVQLPFSCRQGCCTQCAVRVRSGQLHQPEALGISSVLKEKGYGLLCVGYALSDLELETQDEDEVYLIQFGRYHGKGTIVRDDYALDLFTEG